MDKIALVTGGSRGIGLGIAKKLASEGWKIAINGMRKESQLEPTMEELRSLGTQVIYVQGNVASLEDQERMIAEVNERLGSINLLVNNAGIAPKKRMDLLETSPESYDEVMGVNLKGPFFLTQKVASLMIEKKTEDEDFIAQIINIGSISATIASINRGEYCLSKAGMGMMTMLFASRLGEYNIPVYELRPGVIATDMTSQVKEKYDQLIENGLTVQKRWGKPEDVGAAVASLARGEFNYSSGQAIYIDGGISIQRL